ncbi:hypothetical protein V8E51_019149 [Hyaloscypha variabilis]
MRYTIALLALAASVFAAPVDKRQSNSTDVSDQNNQNSNGQDLNNGQNLDLNNQFDVNGLDLSNLDANSLDLNDLNVQDILNALSFQILEQQLLGSDNNINSLNSLDLNNVNDLQFNNFDLDQFNSLFDSQFSVGSIFQLLEGLGSSNILDSNNLEQNNNVIDLDSFANSFNDQFQSSWQSNEILALIESISGQQNLQQLEDLAQLSGLDNNNDVIAAQIQEVSI